MSFSAGASAMNRPASARAQTLDITGRQTEFELYFLCHRLYSQFPGPLVAERPAGAADMANAGTEPGLRDRRPQLPNFVCRQTVI